MSKVYLTDFVDDPPRLGALDLDPDVNFRKLWYYHTKFRNWLLKEIEEKKELRRSIERVKTQLVSVIDAPTTSEDRIIMYTSNPISITSIVESLKGSSTPTVDYKIQYCSTRNGTWIDLFSTRTLSSESGTTFTLSGYDGEVVEIPSGNYIRVSTSGTSGSVDSMEIILNYEEV